MNDKIRDHHAGRKAILYIRQSTMQQVVGNLESRELQYAMKQHLHELGWQQVDVIDEDMGRSASGAVERTGFQRMVAEVCLGNVGAVAAREVSRFARNNKDWHQLIEMCRVVDTLLIDHETVFDPRNSNDRLLLGLKGSMSTYELDLLRQRALDARRQKAARGEMWMTVPAGYVNTDDGCGIQKDPDRRIQQAILRVFEKFIEVGSARQTLLWHVEHALDLPVRRPVGPRGSWQTVWLPPTASIIARMLTNPIYAGIYAYGRRRTVSVVHEGLIKKMVRACPPEQYEALLVEHHEGYISRETFERIKAMLKNNSTATPGSSGAAKHGLALLAGLLRCARCGRKLGVTYTGTPRLQRYACSDSRMIHDKLKCLSLGGRGVDDAVAAELLRVVQPGALEAAAQAAREVSRGQDELTAAIELELTAARYAAERARRQYDNIDPENRLVADELESRWNTALTKVCELERRVEEARQQHQSECPDPQSIMDLTADMERLWGAASTDVRLKKRLVRTLVEEIIIDVDSEASLVELVIHWQGGVHTELQVHRRRRGQHGKATSVDAIDAVRVLARIHPDGQIAQVLNLNGLRTGKDNPWTSVRVKSLRSWHEIVVHTRQVQQADGWMTLQQAALHVGVSPKTLRVAAERQHVNALHPLARGPWIFNRCDLDSAEVQRHLSELVGRRRANPAGRSLPDRTPTLPGM